MFSKLHYEQVAKVMQDTCPLKTDESAKIQWTVMVSAFASMFEDDNDNFDKSRFVYACKPGSNVKAKTAEKLGPVGQGMSIEAQAVVLLQSENG